jgi:hypothetical protein
MKAVLEFDLPIEHDEYDTTMKAIPMSIFISEFGHYIRRKYKHEDPKSAEAFAEYTSIVDKWYEMLGEAGLED